MKRIVISTRNPDNYKSRTRSAQSRGDKTGNYFSPFICQSLIVSRILYALLAWGGLLSAELKGRINAFLRRLYKYGFMHSIIDTEYLLASSDRKLFRYMQKCEHCLNHLLPPRKNNVIALRPVGHEFLLPICNYELHRRSFVVRCLFNFLTE